MSDEPSFSEPHSLYKFLREALEDGGKAAMERVGSLARVERELLIKGPCIAALTAWGDAGFALMIDNALRTQTSKDTSNAIKALAAVASETEIASELLFIHDEDVLRLINTRIRAGQYRAIARRRLAEMIMSIPSKDLLISLGASFTQLSFANPEAAGEIISAISSKWLGFGPRELDQFELLINQKPESEPDLHDFLERYPQILDPLAVQVWSKPDFHGFKEPDFLIRRSDDTYLVVEIENAAKQLITQAGQPSSHVTQAVKQANDYQGFLRRRLPEARTHFPEIDDIDGLVVIGIENLLSPSQAEVLRNENMSRSKLRIVGFDWVVNRSRAIIANVSTSNVQLVKKYRVI
jgi:cellobiose-specific phosphotransferase system component IIA